MISENPNAPNGMLSGVSLRPEREKDETFLLAVYASTRLEELALTGWDDATRQQFVEMQFKAMRQGYATAFSQAEFSIILLDGHPIGRVVVNRTDREIRIVDMALLSEHRGKGIGTDLMQAWRTEAVQCRKPLRLRVVKSTRPANWYNRLGFVPIDEDGIHAHLEFRGKTIESLPNAESKTA